MDANDTNKDREEGKIIHRELSYIVTGLCFKAQNQLGRFCREKQYGDALETLFKQNNIGFEREKELTIDLIDNEFTNKVDYAIEAKILLDLKSKDFIEKEDYYQMQRYLKASNCRLGLIINFRDKYLKPKRVLRLNS